MRQTILKLVYAALFITSSVFGANLNISKTFTTKKVKMLRAKITYIKTEILANNRLKIKISYQNIGKIDIESKKLIISGYLLNRNIKHKIFSTHSATKLRPNQHQRRVVTISGIDCNKINSKTRLYIELSYNRVILDKKLTKFPCKKIVSQNRVSKSITATKPKNIVIKHNSSFKMPQQKLYVSTITTEIKKIIYNLGDEQRVYFINTKFTHSINPNTYNKAFTLKTINGRILKCLKPRFYKNNSAVSSECLCDTLRDSVTRKIRYRDKRGGIRYKYVRLFKPVKIIFSNYLTSGTNKNDRLNSAKGFSYTTKWIEENKGKDTYRRR